ncbi:MAG: dUTP diphosphatase [Deltaproteobacteria bacterium]|nr:dUTP diphosphatase [Deltaproteobacteria bacterium]MDH4122060.1 dUTP diphosphatase [Deltaproteobacteria bacterium]
MTRESQDHDRVVVQVQCHYPGMELPRQGHPNDAGYDLTAMAVEPLREGVFAFDTGISVAPAPGYYCEVVPRSSIMKSDFIMANSVGIIDPDYRGRIRVVLRYLGAGHPAQSAEALAGTRIAQLIVRRRENAVLQAADNLDDTARGSGGFGSTGK